MTPDIEDLVNQIIPQARTEAWRAFQRAPHALDVEELESIALSGLVQAAARWQDYCAENGYDPARAVDGYFAAYSLRRMRGAILDYLRSIDWVTRNVRQRAKQLQAAGDGAGPSEADLVAMTGLTIQQVRDTRAAVASRPVSLDEGDRDVVAPGDVEGAALVSTVLSAVSGVRRDLLPETQVVLALRYFEGWSFADISNALGFDLSRVAELHETGVRVVHDAMLHAVA